MATGSPSGSSSDSAARGGIETLRNVIALLRLGDDHAEDE
jgi:hypothetical protein